MSTKTIIGLLSACLLATSCNAYSPEIEITPALPVRVFFACVDNQSDTRTSLTPEFKVLWDESGEAITLLDEGGACYELVQTSVSEDRRSAEFKGAAPESGILYAVYPAQADIPFENGRLELSIPSEQEAVPGSFDTGTNLAVAKVGTDNKLLFRNVCGLIGFCVNNSGITSIRLSATETSGGALSGSAGVAFDGDLPLSYSSKETGAEYVELQGVIQPGVRYYVMVYPGAYSSVELLLSDDQGRTATVVKESGLTVKRNTIVHFKAIDIAESDWIGGEEEEPGGTATLTYEEAKEKTKGYNNPTAYTNSYGTWTVSAYNTGSAFQLNKDKVAYLGTPAMPGTIKSIKLHNTADRSGNFIVCTEPGNTAPAGNKVESAYNNSGDYTIDVSTLESKQLYIRSSAVSYITYVTLVWGGSGSTPDPEPDPEPDPGTPHEPNGLADYGWFELPAQTDKNMDGIDDNNSDYYYSHTFRADAPKIRNFSCCYSKGNMQPVWVAAPMHTCYKGSSGRNDSYKADPNIKCTQASKVDGYTRGHMLGSSDRTVSKETNRQVFYYSNIGAQLQSGFNTGGGSWNNLESLTDGQWCKDTLYQVIGCIFTRFTDRYGKTVEPKTVGSVHIPTAYYKVLLRTKNGQTGKRVDQCAASELKCAAFILGHRTNAGHKPSASDMYTVDELEAITGLTYFVNVPNAPKDVALASDWGL